MVFDSSQFKKYYKKKPSNFVRWNTNRGREGGREEQRSGKTGISFPFCYLKAHLNQLLLYWRGF